MAILTAHGKNCRLERGGCDEAFRATARGAPSFIAFFSGFAARPGLFLRIDTPKSGVFRIDDGSQRRERAGALITVPLHPVAKLF